MKYFYIFLMLPVVAFAATITPSEFDQDKLENLLNQIPSAFQMSEEENGFIRKYFSYPNFEAPFKIYCNGDYYNSAKLATFKSCKVNLTEAKKTEGISVSKKNNEYKILIKNPTLASEIFKVISFGAPSKQMYSNERVYGKSFEGESRNLFRYRFNCAQKSCEITFTDLPSEDKADKVIQVQSK